MNAKTLEAIKRHGQSLLKAFPFATERNPVALCKKLRRIENAVSKWTLQACNGPEVPEEKLDAECDKALARVGKLLNLRNFEGCGLFVNRDPRGYALKFSVEWTRHWNTWQRCLNDGGLPIHADWGGYGILAPDLTIK